MQVNPHHIATVADALAKRMSTLDPDNAAVYAARVADFLDRWGSKIAEWERKSEPLRGVRVITHHKSWVYLEQWLGLEEVANLEPIAGLPPTPTHLGKLVSRFKDGGAEFIIRSPYQDDKPSNWLSNRTGIPAVMLPLSVGGSDEANTLFALFDDIVDRLLEAHAGE